MKYLGDIREDVRTLLSDKYITGQAQQYSDDELEQAIESTLAELSLIRPRQVMAAVEADGTKKIDLTSITDEEFDLSKLIRVVKAEYKTGQNPERFRNVSRFGNVITLEITIAPTSGDHINLYCEAQHSLTEEETTLTAAMEALLTTGAAGKAASAKAAEFYNYCKKALADFNDIQGAIENMASRIAEAVGAINSGEAAANGVAAILSKAEGELDKVEAEVTQAVADLDSGRSAIVGIDNAKAAAGYANYAQSGVNNARGYIAAANGYLNEAQAKDANSSSYLRQAGEQMTAATGYLNQSSAYVQQARTKLSVVNIGNSLAGWGNSKVAEFRNRMNRMAGQRENVQYSPD